MARQPRTPGATTETPKTTETEVVTTTTAEQADAALNAILGAPETTASTEATSTASGSVEGAAEDPERTEYEEFLAWKQSKAAVKTPPSTQHVPTSDATGSVQVQAFLSPDGWTSKGGE